MRIQIALCLALGTCLVASACTFVGEADYRKRLTEMDDDGDGFAIDGGGDDTQIDCDDANADINPGADEIWYDGIDQNCDGKNDFDQDEDGYYAELPDDDEPDCNDADNLVNPNMPETWYDGIDSDCAGDDDFDQDKDTHCPLGMDAEAGRLCQDCDDDNILIYTGAPDTWYDGIDSDCAGNDDFDADLDGQCNVDHAEAAGQVCEDCDDDNILIYTGAPDTWYDGIDSDCGGANLDFDQDRDGFDCDDDPNVTGDCDGHTGTDCDDTDATTHEGALEQLGDTVDHDCDGDGTRFIVEDLGYAWTNPQSAVLAANDIDVYLSVVTEQVQDNDASNTNYYDTAAALRWSASSLGDGPQELVVWQESSASDPLQIVTPGQGLYLTNARIYGVTGSLFGSQRFLTFSEYTLADQTKVVLSKPHNADEATYCPAQNCPDLNAFSDISLDLDVTNSVIHALGCNHDDSGNVQYLRINSVERQIGTLDPSNPSGLHDVGARPSSCQLTVQSGTTGGVILADETQGGSLTEWSFELGSSVGFNPSVLSVDGTLTVDDISRYADFSGGTTHIVVSTTTSRIYVMQGGIQQIIFPASGNAPIQATAAQDSTGQIYVVWTEQNGQVGLAWGDMSGFFGQASVNATILADEAHIAVPDGTHVLLAILGEGEVHAGIAVQ